MAAPSITYTFVNSTSADAGQVNTNFSDLVNAMTDGTKDFTIGALTINGNLAIGNAVTDTITLTSRFVSDLIPSTDSARSLGSSSLAFVALHLNNDSTDGGAVYFNNSTTSFLKSNAAGTALDVGGFTSMTGADVTNMTQAWVNFNGQGTVAIRASHNVDSITDGGTGLYTVNWDTDFSDANYGVFAWSSLEETRHSGMTAAAVSIETSSSGGTQTDAQFVMAAGIGRQSAAN